MKHTIIKFMIPIAAGLIVGSAQASDPNGYLKGIEPAEDPDLRRQHTFTAGQIAQCQLFAVTAEFESVTEILSKNMRIYQRMAGIPDKEGMQQAFNSTRNATSMVIGYIEGYKARLLETGGDISQIDKQFHVNTGKALYRKNLCDQWATFMLDTPDD